MLQRQFWHLSVGVPCLVSSTWFRLFISGYLANQLPFVDIQIPLWTTTLPSEVTSVAYENFIPFPQMQSHPKNPKLSEAATPGMNGSQVWSSSSHLPAAGLCSCKESCPNIPHARALCVTPAHCYGAADCAEQGLTSCFIHLLLNKYNKMHYMINNLQVGIKYYKF